MIARGRIGNHGRRGRDDFSTDTMARSTTSIGLVLIAHGSRYPRANEELVDVANSLRRRGFPHVFPAYLEIASPDIVSAGLACAETGVARIVLLPYFLSAGRHAITDLEAARTELARRLPRIEFLLADPLGPHPLLEEILLERVSSVVPE